MDNPTTTLSASPDVKINKPTTPELDTFGTLKAVVIKLNKGTRFWKSNQERSLGEPMCTISLKPKTPDEMKRISEANGVDCGNSVEALLHKLLEEGEATSRRPTFNVNTFSGMRRAIGISVWEGGLVCSFNTEQNVRVSNSYDQEITKSAETSTSASAKDATDLY